MEEEIYQTRIQHKIENIVTKGTGFNSTPKNFSIETEKVNTLLGLRMYLSAIESNVSLFEGNFKNFHIASCYLDTLFDIRKYKELDPNDSKSIDEAIEKRREAMIKFFDIEIGAAA